MSIMLAKLLDVNTTVTNGPPQEVGSMDEAVIQISGIVAGDTVKIQGSNNDPKDTPSASLLWIDIELDGSPTIAVNGAWVLSELPNLIRARREADAGAGTVTVLLKAVR